MPIAIQLSARGILDAQSATNKEELETASAQWEGDLIVESKFSEDLLQVRLALAVILADQNGLYNFFLSASFSHLTPPIHLILFLINILIFFSSKIRQKFVPKTGSVRSAI
jgi:hypothetical protein